MTATRVLTAAAAAILFWQLILPPVVGLANNGDFSRTYGIFHLTMPVADEVRFADTRYRFDPRVNYFGGHYSSEILLLPPALALNAIFSKDGSFDIRFLGAVHAALFLAAFALFLPLLEDAPRNVRWRFGGLALFLFCDVMYAAYLNSFYSDAGAYVFLLLAVVLALRVLRWRRRTDTILLCAASLLLATSKSQHALLGLWIAGFLWLLGSRKVRVFVAVLAAVALLWLWKGTPEEQGARGCFSTIFARLVPHSQDPDRTLAALGLDARYRPYIGMISYSGGSPMADPAFVAAFRRKVTYRSLAVFLLTHPRDAYVAIRVSLDEAGRQRPPLGNFDPSANLAPYAESQSFAIWSNFKRGLFESRGSRYLTCFAGLAAVVAILLMRRRGTLPRGAVAAGLILIGMAFTELAVASLADAVDVVRHHLLVYALVDVLLLALGWLSARPEPGR